MRNSFLAILLVFFIVPTWAAMSPQELVVDTSQKTITRLKAEKETIKKDPGRLYDLVNDTVIPHFDFERASRWVLGKYWRKASAEQQKRFVEEFKNLLVRTYATSLADYADQKLTYLPFRDKEDAEEVTVRSEVDQPGGFPIPINYRLHKKNGAWKVFDVVIDGISLVSNYRTSFAKEIREANIEALIKKLEARNKKAMQ